MQCDPPTHPTLLSLFEQQPNPHSTSVDAAHETLEGAERALPTVAACD